jgi:hypothetical protein
MMRRVANLRINNAGRLSAIHNNGESIKNLKYLIEFEGKFEKSLNTEQGEWEEFIYEKTEGKKSRWTVRKKIIQIYISVSKMPTFAL